MELRSFLLGPLARLFSRQLSPSSAPEQRYQTLPGELDGDDDEDGSPDCVCEDGSNSRGESAAVHRDAAALLLIKLGRSPTQRIHVSPEDSARILRRIDIALLPIMLIVYFLHALDKATLSYASVFGLIDDTHLTGSQFSWLGSIVYVAQLLMQFPVAWALVKLPIGTFTSIMVLCWGITLTTMAWASVFPALLGSRFLLGAFEASVGPSFVAITQMWWRRREQTVRVGSWYCMNGLTWVFGSLVTYSLAKINSSLRPYQVIFLFFGAITVVVATVMFFSMPNSPTEARFLSDDDKVLAIGRLQDNRQGVMSREWRRSHFIEALCDVKTWLWFSLVMCASVPSNSFSTFGPLIIQSFVEDPFQTMLFNIPVGLSHFFSVTASTYLSMRWKLKGPMIAILCVPPIIGLGVLLAFEHDTANKGILLAGYFCLSTFTGITPLIFSWSSQNTAGDTKRKCTSALVFVGSSAGNIIGPLLFTPEEAPSYTRGLRASIALFAVVVALVAITSVYLVRLNHSHARRRVALGKSAVAIDTSLDSAASARMVDATRREPDEDREDVWSGENEAAGDKTFSDATDLENEDFVYVY
ncbi:Major Facilitator Superfamily [Geosmithia morbida]|uniref:Major Facilitator Superfamily n=1 Tax=Geosmithia morbida TaxID=1094350 RepID=A0A9P5D977_9HYPO|nr:Major Facilitator Superfamily [Geosmithia morbida]KAF4126229.1 Major Facilitator Superfamily [Geosmithia morbida]